jgi:predicted carbohydrate-binding protein with CBM5 and CBM33 domain
MIAVNLEFSNISAAAEFFNACRDANITIGGDDSNKPSMANLVSMTQKDDKPFANVAKNAVDNLGEKIARVGRPKKEKAPAEAGASQVASEPAQKSESSSKPVDIEAVRAALNAYVSANDFAAGTALVNSFKSASGDSCQRLSELQVADYAAFIEKAKVSA